MNQAEAITWAKLIAEKYGGSVEFDLVSRWCEVDVPEENATRCAQEIADIIGSVDVEYATVQ
jgi:hypothetical protein